MVPMYLAKGYTVNRELEIAVERAARAAVVDPLVEAIEALRAVVRYCVTPGGVPDNGRGRTPNQNRAISAANRVLAKYAPDRAGGGE